MSKILKWFFKPKMREITIIIGNAKSYHINYYGEKIKESFTYKGTKVEIEIK